MLLRGCAPSKPPGIPNAQFESLRQRFQPRFASFASELRKKRNHYLAFLPDPRHDPALPLDQQRRRRRQRLTGNHAPT
jgi:hypothetical protein